MKQSLFVGTGGFSVWHSDDLGASFARLLSDSGLYSESRIYALAANPGIPEEILVGTDSGIYRLDAVTRKFSHQPSPMDQTSSIWSIAFDPSNPSTVLAGTRPAGIFRSTDGGRSWIRAEADVPSTCPAVLIPRVTKIHFSPENPELVWASLEIGGIWHSTNGGINWARAASGLVSDDVHDVTCMPTTFPRAFAATNKGLHRSDDDGATWALHELDIPVPYLRTVVSRADHAGTIFAGVGDGPPGSMGRLLRSRDFGETWEQGKGVGLPPDADSTFYSIAVNPVDPNLIFAATALGQFFRSRDGGETWDELPRRLGEIRSLVWVAV
jgi:photosystem II stability/assembly factor-like uncharacterized protein